jgi:hypothetical protein
MSMFPQRLTLPHGKFLRPLCGDLFVAIQRLRGGSGLRMILASGLIKACTAHWGMIAPSRWSTRIEDSLVVWALKLSMLASQTVQDSCDAFDSDEALRLLCASNRN